MSTRNLRRIAKKHQPKMHNGPVQIQIGVQGNIVAMTFDRPVTRIDFTADEAMAIIQGLHNNVSILAERARAVAPANEPSPPTPPEEVMPNTVP